MKANAVTAALLAIAAPVAQAQIAPISTTSLVHASGSASVPAIYGGENQAYDETHAQSTSGLYASFSDSVAGSAFAEITIMPPFELFFGTTLSAWSEAHQISNITLSELSLSSSVVAAAAPYSQVGGRQSAARSLFDVTFSIETPVTYDLSGYGSHFQTYPIISTFATSLTSSAGETVFDFTHMTDYEGLPSSYWFSIEAPITGVLKPDVYRFVSDVQALGMHDPLGDSGSGFLSVNLRVRSVPDGGSTGWLCAVGCWALLLVRRSMRPIRRGQAITG